MSCFTSENGLTPEKPLCLPYDILNDGFLYYILCQIKAHAAERRRTQLRAFGMGLSVPAEQRDAGVKRGGYPNAYGTRAVCLLPGGAEAVLSACIYCKSFEEASGV